MTLNSISNCSKEQYSIILKSKYGNNHKNEKAFYYGLWCIKDTMREISEGPFQAILPYTEYPLNELIKLGVVLQKSVINSIFFFNDFSNDSSSLIIFTIVPSIPYKVG